jgi:hypothetical protein
VHLLEVDDGVDRVTGLLEDGENTVTEGLDDAAAMLLANVADPGGETGDRTGRTLVAERFEHRGASREICKDDGCV